MSSPFPGMDPYLEASSIWPGVHNTLIAYLTEELNRELPPEYVARLDERLYVEEPMRKIVPDIAVTRRPHPGAARQLGDGGAATLERGAEPETFSLPRLEVRETFINIQTAARPRRIVTVIEILSHANKTGGAGRRLYQQKQQEVLNSEANLLEIDLLRRGRHTVVAPREGIQQFGTWNYLACLNRVESRETFEFWRIGLRQRLPDLKVPLSEDEPDVWLNLQAAFDRMYDAGRYPLVADYAAPPAVPLEGEDAEWADALLREKGLRGTVPASDAAQE